MKTYATLKSPREGVWQVVTHSDNGIKISEEMAYFKARRKADYICYGKIKKMKTFVNKEK